MFKAQVITCSDKGFRGEREDTSGEYIKQFLINFSSLVNGAIVINPTRSKLEQL